MAMTCLVVAWPGSKYVRRCRPTQPNAGISRMDATISGSIWPRMGSSESLKRYGFNAPGKILGAISEAFETDIFSEYEPQYWAFNSQEEWEAAWKRMDDQHSDQKLYADVCAYVRGEPSDIRPGTIGETKTKIAKSLVETDASLLQPESRDRLLAEMDTIYDRDHAVIITLGPEDIALAKMLVTHEDDLPQA